MQIRNLNIFLLIRFSAVEKMMKFLLIITIFGLIVKADIPKEDDALIDSQIAAMQKKAQEKGYEPIIPADIKDYLENMTIDGNIVAPNNKTISVELAFEMALVGMDAGIDTSLGTETEIKKQVIMVLEAMTAKLDVLMQKWLNERQQRLNFIDKNQTNHNIKCVLIALTVFFWVLFLLAMPSIYFFCRTKPKPQLQKFSSVSKK
ncbi:hypothetical protein M3Y96_00176500 [Aphelenchoides besseyi]|nr:hypothetical protein M3Y96_00176500 [Aphelenchoides besseyi]